MRDSPFADFFPIHDVPDRIPHTSRGRRVSLATVQRWARKGLNGCRLGTIRIGSTLCTSDAELRKFFELSARSNSVDGSRHSLSDPGHREQLSKSVEKRLNEIGI